MHQGHFSPCGRQLYVYFYMKPGFLKALATSSNNKPFYSFYHVASLRINEEKCFTIPHVACSNPYIKVITFTLDSFILHRESIKHIF